MPNRKKKQGIGVAGKIGSKKSAALRRAIKKRMPEYPHAVRGEMLRDRLDALRPEEPQAERREKLKARLSAAAPKMPGQPKYRRSRR